MSRLTARFSIALLAFFAFLLGQVVRLNINIAIVAMADKRDATTALLLGSYYWCGWLAELPSGLLAQRRGARVLLAVSMMVGGAAGSALFPPAYALHPACGAAVRALQGAALTAVWPAVACLSAKWIPRDERSKFMSSYHGAALGSSVAFGLGGLLVDALGWPAMFYATGALCALWTAAWWRVGYDTPASHPRIAPSELTHLDAALPDAGASISRTAPPWTRIAASRPFWAVLVASFGLIWCSVTLTIHLPIYLDRVHDLDIKTSGLVLSLPSVCKFLFGLKFSALADHWIKAGRWSVSAARRTAVVFTHVIPAGLLAVLGVFGGRGGSVHLAAGLLLVTLTCGGASSTGTLANIVDISPRNAGAVMGLIRTLCVVPGVLSPLVVHYFTSEDSGNWFPVFWSTSAILLVSGVAFLLFSSGEVQPWDTPVCAPTLASADDNKELQVMIPTSTQLTPVLKI